ncbi:hypothetical protein C8T65DRAFT_627331 [Cerioporus squamosus]|nr:hypothetical protein C8T65DRAFT_627331 [Cerioporus squamosus]
MIKAKGEGPSEDKAAGHISVDPPQRPPPSTFPACIAVETRYNMTSSTKITAFLGSQRTLTFNTMSDVLPYASQLTGIDVQITGFQFTHQAFLNFLQAPMPKLSSIAFNIIPGGLPHSDLIFEYSPQRFPALMALSLDGIGLKCTSLGNLLTVELRNFPEQPATSTFNGLLDLLDTSARLTRLTLDNYLSMAFNDQPSRRSPVTMRALKELCVRDTPQQTARLLHHLRQLPKNAIIGGLHGNTRFERQPSKFNAFLAMLPQGRPDLYYPILTDTTTAKLELSEDTVRLVCSGRQGQLVLEVHSTLRLRPDTQPAIYGVSYSAVVAAAGAILGLARALTTLECTGTPTRGPATRRARCWKQSRLHRKG